MPSDLTNQWKEQGNNTIKKIKINKKGNNENLLDSLGVYSLSLTWGGLYGGWDPPLCESEGVYSRNTQ